MREARSLSGLSDHPALQQFLRTIRIERRVRGWNQATMASKVGLGRAGYERLERGTRRLTLSEALRICEVFGARIDDLLSGERWPTRPAWSADRWRPSGHVTVDSPCVGALFDFYRERGISDQEAADDLDEVLFHVQMVGS